MGGIEITKQSLFNDKLVFSFPTQDYTLDTNGTPDNSLKLVAATSFDLNFENTDNDYLEDLTLGIHGGFTDNTEYSKLLIKYNSVSQDYEIFNDSPIRNYDLVFKNNNQNNQLVLKSDGTTAFSNLSLIHI